MNTKLIMVLLLGIAYVWLFILAKRVIDVLDGQKAQEWALEKEEKDREIMTEHMEGLSEQLLEFVFDTSKVAKPVFEEEFQKLLPRVFWSLPGEDGSRIYVKGLNYEVGEHIVIKAEDAEMLLKVVGIVKVDKVNESTELVCEYVSGRKKKDRHSYMDVYDMFYTMRSELDNVKEIVLNQNSMRRHEIEDLEKEMKKELEHTQKELEKVKETTENNVIKQVRKNEDILNRVRENYASVNEKISLLKQEVKDSKEENKKQMSSVQTELTKENQEREQWLRAYVNTTTNILNEEIKQLKEEIKELRREVALGADE